MDQRRCSGREREARGERRPAALAPTASRPSTCAGGTGADRRHRRPGAGRSGTPDSDYTDFATSAGAANAGADQNPTTVGLEGFSGQGPVNLVSTTVCSASYPCPATAPVGQNQSVPGGGGRTALAPTYTAADGVSVSGVGGFGVGACPAETQGDCRFFGTSAATPSSAGVAALVLDASGGPRVADALRAHRGARSQRPGSGSHRPGQRLGRRGTRRVLGCDEPC